MKHSSEILSLIVLFIFYLALMKKHSHITSVSKENILWFYFCCHYLCAPPALIISV